MPSAIYADEVDAGISGSSVKTSTQGDSNLLPNSAMLFFFIVPSLWSVEECWWYCNQFVLQHISQVYVTTPEDCQKPPIQYLSVSYQLPILVIRESFLRRYANVDTLHFFWGVPEVFCGCFS